jgi:hypothetical protein
MAPWHHVGATMEITLDKNGSLYDPAGTESCDMQIRLVSYLDKDENIYIWDYGDHQLRLTIAPRCVTTVPRVRLHGSPGGVFVGHRPPRDPGDPPHIYIYLYTKSNRSFTSVQMCHTHTYQGVCNHVGSFNEGTTSFPGNSNPLI